MDNYTKQVTILYVEDEDDVRDGYARALERISKHLYTADNGISGLELYKKYMPDIVVTDIRMPKMNGIEMATNIRDLDENANIIFTSAHSESAYLLEAISLRADGYLLKPVQKKLLIQIMQKIAKNIVLEKENTQQREILQHIIDSENSKTIITNTKHVSFASKSFLNFFGVETIEKFQNKFPTLLDVFSNTNNINKTINKENILKSMQNGVDFYEFINQIDESSRIITLANTQDELKSFYLNISKINEISYLINFTDITKLTKEKIETEKKVYKDSLTQIYNREKFEDVFEYEIKQSKRYKTPLSLAILDIDYFKDFNDTYGHLVGDEILVMLSKTISQKARESDLFARWGGEEFVLLFNNTVLEDAINLAESFRQMVESIKHKSARNITVSFGVTQYKENDTTEEMFKRADDALYEAKNSGRNCVKSKY
jgi:diguanylate cyclase (GGDEF)-like protein